MKIKLKTLQECILLGEVKASHLHIEDVSFNLNNKFWLEMFGTEFEAEEVGGRYSGNNIIWPKCMVAEVALEEPATLERVAICIELDKSGATRIVADRCSNTPEYIEEWANKLLEHAEYHRQKAALNEN